MQHLLPGAYPSCGCAQHAVPADGQIVATTFDPHTGSDSITTRVWTKDGRLTSETQPSGGINTANTYGGTTGRLDQVNLTGSGWAHETRFAYDDAGRMATATTEDGATDRVSGYTYQDTSGRLLETDRADDNDERYTYDMRGRVSTLKTVRDSDGAWVGGDEYTYDDADRISARTRREGGGELTTQFEYDPAGQLVWEASEHGIIRQYRYGDANTASFGTDLQEQTLHLDDEHLGVLSAVRVDDIESCLTATSCSPAGGDAAAINTAIDAITEPGTVLDPASLSGAGEDVARWLALRSGRSWEPAESFAVGACIAADGGTFKATTGGTSGGSEPSWPGSGSVNDGSVVWEKTGCEPILTLREYQYDGGSPSLHQLVGDTDRQGRESHYHYDALGNQDYRCVDGAPNSCPGAYTGSGAGAANQTFDVLNRPTLLVDDTGQEIALTWWEDKYQLKSQTDGSTCWTYHYDADGQLRRRTEWDEPSCGGTKINDITYAYDQTGISAAKSGGSWYYLDRTLRGDVIGVRDQTGDLDATIRYTAYGEVWTDNPSLVDTLAITYNGRDGVVALGEGLLWMQHRVYSSAQGRFVGADRVEPKEGSTQGAYNYADSDPANGADPTGLKCAWSTGPSHLVRYGSGWRLWGYLECNTRKRRTPRVTMWHLNQTGCHSSRCVDVRQWNRTGDRSKWFAINRRNYVPYRSRVRAQWYWNMPGGGSPGEHITQGCGLGMPWFHFQLHWRTEDSGNRVWGPIGRTFKPC